MSAIVIDRGAAAPFADFQDTVLPSADTETVPSCFLYWAAALDMVEEEKGGGCHRLLREPQIASVLRASPLT